MQRTYRKSMLLAAALTVVAGAALAQTRPQPAPPPGEPSFRDPTTGRIYTPDNVGNDTKPVAPEDRAFDPSGQAVVERGVFDESVIGRPIRRIPITAGPTVPLVDVGGLQLRVEPGDRWRVMFQLRNNSANLYEPVVVCRFTNGGQPVATTRAHVGPTGPGEEVELTVRGPRGEDYVDQVRCAVTSP
ncbi:MAG TPA: hypothetical protein VMI56_06040 [Reyranella sp.]|nr:hypothetical protein [Reyranella sp.]